MEKEEYRLKWKIFIMDEKYMKKYINIVEM